MLKAAVRMKDPIQAVRRPMIATAVARTDGHDVAEDGDRQGVQHGQHVRPAYDRAVCQISPGLGMT